MLRRPLPLVAFAVQACWGAADPTLERIVARMTELLARAPNYTCTETIERWNSRQPCPDCEQLNRFRLEVAVIGKQERFAWPGDSGFVDKPIYELIGKGESASGNFMGLLSAVFLHDRPSFAFAAEEKTRGRRALRYDFAVQAEHSSQLVRMGAAAAVPYHGSFWVDAASLDILRLEVRIPEVPPELGSIEVRTLIDYAPARIGAAEFLLPRDSENEIVYPDGRKSRSRWRFVNCRQYVGQSTIRFSETPEDVPGGPAGRLNKIRAAALPPGLAIATLVPAPINVDTAAAGDPISLTVYRPVTRDGVILVPKNASLVGRLTSVAVVRRDRRQSRWAIALELSHVEFGDTRTPLRARIRDCRAVFPRQSVPGMFETIESQTLLIFEGSVRMIPAGFQMLWESVEP